VLKIFTGSRVPGHALFSYLFFILITLLLINADNEIFSLAGAPSTHQVAAQIVSEEQREVSVIVGETLTIECIATGWPVPEVTWSRYGGQLPRQRHQQLNGRLFTLATHPYILCLLWPPIRICWLASHSVMIC